MRVKGSIGLFFSILFAAGIYAQKPEFVFPVGQTGPVETAKFSHNGKFVLTISDDNSAKIWETKSGKLLHTLSGHLNGIVTSDIRFDDSLITVVESLLINLYNMYRWTTGFEDCVWQN